MKIDNSHILFLDIETVPGTAGYKDLSEPMQELWAKKSMIIDKENDDYAATYFNRAGIYSEFGRIVCISVGYINRAEKLHVKSFTGEEREILTDFFIMVNDFFSSSNKYFCGHNIREFDIPYICRRGLIVGVRLPKVLADLQAQKPWELPILDTLQLWKFGDYKNFASLNLLANVFGIETPKGDIDGSDVARVYYNEQDIKRIAAYCQRDVVTTVNVYRKLTGKDIIQNGQIEEK